MLSRSNDTDISALVEEILHFGLSGVARPELFKFVPQLAPAAGKAISANESFFVTKTRLTCQFTLLKKPPMATPTRV